MALGPKISEQDVATAVMAYLVREGWECWPEVEIPGGRADIVAVRPFPFLPHRRCVHIVETKTSWSLDLLEQAVDRRRMAHYVSIAAPTKRGFFYERLCRDFGIGTLQVWRQGFGENAEFHVSEIDSTYRDVRPRLQRHTRNEKYFGPERCLSLLCDDQKRYTPGSTAAAGYSTEWRRTMDRAAKFVADHPGCTVKELARSVEHHYSTAGGARQGFLTWLAKRTDIVARKEQGAMRFYPPEAPPAAQLI
jgi:hypothetical protein